MNNKAQAQSGFVYILSNESMPGLVKVGFTTNDPRKRAKELQSSGVPTPFKVELAMFCDNAYEVEQCAHENLSDYRVKNREFFNVHLRHAMEIVFGLIYDGLYIADDFNRISDQHVCKYSGLAECEPWEVLLLLHQITPKEWKELKQRRGAK
jgi:hypothetical protein